MSTPLASGRSIETYSLTDAAIEALPGGGDQRLDQILLQLPGVAQGGFGEIHVRGGRDTVQYRINGTILPQGAAVLARTLSPRIIERLNLRTGALSAQYGLHTEVIELTTRTGSADGARVTLYGGSYGTIAPSIEYGGATDATSYFVTGSYRRDDFGIEAVDGNRSPLHDTSNQLQAFGVAEHALGNNDRVSLVGGYSDRRYEVPNPRGLHPGGIYRVAGRSDFLSDDLDARQRENSAFAIASLRHEAGALELQASAFAHHSELDYTPDTLGELLFRGVARQVAKRDLTSGVQVEGVFRASGAHVLRAGTLVTRDRAVTRTVTQVFALDTSGKPLGQPFGIGEHSSATEWTYGAYLQDEWKPFAPLTVNIGGRFDHYDGLRSERQFSPRADAKLVASRALAFHIGYARTFSPPTFANVSITDVARFRGTSAQAAGLISDAPYAETQDVFDLGAELKLGPAITLGIDGYHRHAHRLLDEGQFGAPIVLTPFNYDHGNATGVEVSGRYRSRGLLAYGSIAFARAEGEYIVSSQASFDPAVLAYVDSHFIRLDHDQTWSGSGGVSYQVNGGTNFAASMIYGSGQRSRGLVPNGNGLPGYLTVNLTARHLFRGAGIELRGDVINAADRPYQIRDGSAIGAGAPRYGQRRGFFLAASKGF